MGPGFGIDEDMSTLGQQLVLPPFLEPRREQIVANLRSSIEQSSVWCVPRKHPMKLLTQSLKLTGTNH